MKEISTKYRITPAVIAAACTIASSGVTAYSRDNPIPDSRNPIVSTSKLTLWNALLETAKAVHSRMTSIPNGSNPVSEKASPAKQPCTASRN